MKKRSNTPTKKSKSKIADDFLTAILSKSRPAEKHDFPEDPAILPSPRSPRAAATVPRCLTRALAAQQKEQVTNKMTEALMKLVKTTATRTVDIMSTSFTTASVIFFCYLFLLFCCALS